MKNKAISIDVIYIFRNFSIDTNNNNYINLNIYDIEFIIPK